MFINKEATPPNIPIGQLRMKNIIAAFCERTKISIACSLVGKSFSNESGFSFRTKTLKNIFIKGSLKLLNAIAPSQLAQAP